MKKRVFKTIVPIIFILILTSCASTAKQDAAPSPEPTPVETAFTPIPKLDDLYNEAKGYYDSGDYTNLLKIDDQLVNHYPEEPKTKEITDLTVKLYSKTKDTLTEPTASEEPTSKPEVAPEQVKKILSTLNERKDEVREISFFYAQSTSEFVDENDAYVYFSRSKEGVISNPRLKIQYAGDDWIFIDKYTINADGEIFEITPEYSEVVRDNNANGVWEYYETYIDKDKMAMVQKIANAEKVIIRSEGESRHYDMILSKQQKQAMLKVLKAYEDAGGLTILFDIDL